MLNNSKSLFQLQIIIDKHIHLASASNLKRLITSLSPYSLFALYSTLQRAFHRSPFRIPSSKNEGETRSGERDCAN